jgi:hypothetical protein
MAAEEWRVRLVLSILSVLLALVTLASPARATTTEMTAAQARQRVIEIVNQPIRHLPRTDEAGEFSPGWFHDGAIEPDYALVDVRVSQEFPYAHHDYVTSDLNPSEMFVARELEFNAMTKYFYTDRTLPKKRLSEDEMVEINRLYRIIGRDQHGRHLKTIGLVGFGVLLVLAMLLFARRLS